MSRADDFGMSVGQSPPTPIRSVPGAVLMEAPAPGAAAVEVYADVPETTMFPAETAIVAAAAAERRREFATVRHCARQALWRIGMPAVPLVPDTDGVPRWPGGVVGSLTHCPGYRAAAVARARDLAGIGIDAEPHAALPTSTVGLVLRIEELEQRAVLAAAFPRLHWDRVMFCVKEAVYKAWFPLTRRWLGFDDVATMLWPDGTFEARVQVPEPRVGGLDVSRFDGRWAVGRGLVVAVTTVLRTDHRGAKRRTGAAR